MQEIYGFIDEYVKLIYVVRRLNAKLHKLPEFMYASSVSCDFRAMGISEELVAKMEGETSLQDLLDCYNVLSKKADAMAIEVYRTICNLEPELKERLYEYLLSKSSSLTSEATEVQNAYMQTVGQIEEAEQSENTQLIRKLSKIAKSQYSKYYELDSFKNSYTYLGCYMSSMVKRKSSEGINPESGLTLK